MSPLVAPDDQSLLEALASGDVGALERLYERHAPWLAVRLMRRCNDREVVADVLLWHMVGFSRVSERLDWRPSIATNSQLQLAQIGFR